MTPRLRMLAGPNGSGKSTLAAQLSSDYAVNLYRFLNADLLFAEVVQPPNGLSVFNRQC